MYLNALESQSIPGTDRLSLVYLPNQPKAYLSKPCLLLNLPYLFRYKRGSHLLINFVINQST